MSNRQEIPLEYAIRAGGALAVLLVALSQCQSEGLGAPYPSPTDDPDCPIPVGYTVKHPSESSLRVIRWLFDFYSLKVKSVEPESTEPIPNLYSVSKNGDTQRLPSDQAHLLRTNAELCYFAAFPDTKERETVMRFDKIVAALH